MATVTPQVLAPARKYQASAVTILLESYAPLVHRIAYALCPDPQVAPRVTATVLRRAIRVLPRWRDDAEADRWFYHYTVLETRRETAVGRGEACADPLVVASTRNDPAFVALVRALRAMPAQQREAIVLHHGEHLNLRYLGVAMDCSAEAAANHLRAATAHLQQLFGDAVESLLKDLAAAYQRLAPNLEALHPEIRRQVSRFLFPRRIRRVVIVVLLLVIGWAVWHLRHLI